jgi:hypothetical protein
MKWAAMIRSSAVVCWMVPQLLGCTSWRIETVTPATLIARDHPGAPKADRVIALGDVRAVATSHVSVAKTAALGLVIAGAAAMALLTSIQGTFDNWGQ